MQVVFLCLNGTGAISKNATRHWMKGSNKASTIICTGQREGGSTGIAFPSRIGNRWKASMTENDSVLSAFGVRMPRILYRAASKKERTAALVEQAVTLGIPRHRHRLPAEALRQGGGRGGYRALSGGGFEPLRSLSANQIHTRGRSGLQARMPYDHRASLTRPGRAVVPGLAEEPADRLPRLPGAALAAGGGAGPVGGVAGAGGDRRARRCPTARHQQLLCAGAAGTVAPQGAASSRRWSRTASMPRPATTAEAPVRSARRRGLHATRASGP